MHCVVVKAAGPADVDLSSRQACGPVLIIIVQQQLALFDTRCHIVIVVLVLGTGIALLKPGCTASPHWAGLCAHMLSRGSNMSFVRRVVNRVMQTLSDPDARAMYDAIAGFSVDAVNPFADASYPADQVFVDEVRGLSERHSSAQLTTCIAPACGGACHIVCML